MITEESIVSSGPIKSFDYFSLLSILLSKKKMIIVFVFVTTLLSIGISLLLPESFLTTAVILPDTDKGKLSSLGGLSDLASLAGVNVGGDGSMVKLYPTIIMSEAVLKNVIYKKYQSKKFSQPVNLIDFFEIEAKTPELQYESALKVLRAMLGVSIDTKLSVITMSISMPEPQLAADILNEVIYDLDKFIRNKKTSTAGAQRKFVEDRLIEVGKDLTTAENALKQFRENNRVISSSPQLLLEQERLVRNLQINSTVYIELRKQFEIVKIEEVKNIPIINVLDSARTPAKKDKPKKATIVIITFFLSILGSMGYIIIRHQFGHNIIALVSKLRSLNKK